MRNIIKLIVNLLTTFRFIFTIYLMIQFKKIDKFIFLIEIIILYLTDFVDGKLARNFNVQTIYGSKMDTIADKTLSIGLMLLILKKMPILYLLLIEEILIALINIIGKIKRRQVQSSKIGKLKTWLIAISIILSYITYYQITNLKITYIFIILTFLLEIIVAIDYIKYLKKQPILPKEKKANNIKELFYQLFSTKYYLQNRINTH